MTRRRLTTYVGLAMLLAIVFVGAFINVPYAAMAPGPTYNTLGKAGGEQIIVIDGTKTHQISGHLNMTTVSVYDRLTIFDGLYRWVRSDEAVVPREQLFPPGQTRQQVARQDAAQFRSSQNNAVTAALSYLGYGTVVVQQLLSKSPSKGKLAAGDTIVAVNRTKTKTVAALHGLLGKIRPGTPVTVTYARGGKQHTARVTTGKGDQGTAVIGVAITVVAKAPFNVSINVNNVGGPSAGLMFALGILEKLHGDITGGRFIAGTGEIDQLGHVGEIGGIPLKMIAARRAGASVFLVPAGNCAEAKAHQPGGLRLIKMDSLQTALSGLAALRDGTAPPTC